LNTTLSNNTYVIGADIGGTNMQTAVIDASNTIVGRSYTPTNASRGQSAVLDDLVRAVDQACEHAGIARNVLSGVGVAVAGAVDHPSGRVLEAPNLKWSDMPLRDRLCSHFDCPVVIENDVNAALWGEVQCGAAEGQTEALGVWIGTGVGGALVLDGTIYHGAYTTAGEIGHTVVIPETCDPNGPFTVEDLCSRTGILRTVREKLSGNSSSMLHELAGGDPMQLDNAALATAYEQNDAMTCEIIDRTADLLGTSIANLVTMLALNTVVIGGGVTEALGERYLHRIRSSFLETVFPARCKNAEVLMTRLQRDAGLLGAGLLARQPREAQR